MATRTKHPRSPRPPARDTRPDHKIKPGLTPVQYRHIGEAVASWSILETTLQQAIWAFLKLSGDDGRLVTGRMDARPKVEWLRTLGERYLPDGEYATSFFEALARIGELQDNRNFIVHGIWGRLMPENDAIAASLRRDTAPGKIISETFPEQRMNAIIRDINVALNILKRLPAELAASRDK